MCVSLLSECGIGPSDSFVRAPFVDPCAALRSHMCCPLVAPLPPSLHVLLVTHTCACVWQLKDRHNGNILLTNSGHIVHIDFGFMFLSSPGKGMGFETAPFKLTREQVELLGGPHSRTFMRYRELCVKSFMELRKHAQTIIFLVEMLVGGNEDLPCFAGRPDDALLELRDRFKLTMHDAACRDYVNALIDESLENWRTRWYDRYQRCCTGVL